jgi:hypothetical protein
MPPLDDQGRLVPTSVSPAIDAAKHAIIALPSPDRKAFRTWILAEIEPAGAIEDRAAARTPLRCDGAVRAVLRLGLVGRRMMRAWSGRWIDADGELAIPPQRSSPFIYPKSTNANG